MQKKTIDLTLIGYGLALLYATSMLVNVKAYQAQNFLPHSLILIGVYALLLLCAVAVVQFKEWARKGLAIFNFLLGFYLLYLFLQDKGSVSLFYIVMNFVTFFYFSQPKTKQRFQGENNALWKSVLIIDDDELMVKTVRPILISRGYSVLSATSGEDGLRIAKNQKPDLVLLDVILPGIKGREVCIRLKNDPLTKHLPVIFLTAKDSPDDIRAEMAAGAETHLTKPVDPKLLIATVERILQSRG